MTALPTDNPTASSADSVLTAILNAALPELKAAEVSAIPFLGWPVISQVFDVLQDWALHQLKAAMALQVTFLIIDFQTAQEKSAFIAAAKTLRGQLSSPEANAAFDAAFEKMVHWNGAHAST